MTQEIVDGVQPLPEDGSTGINNTPKDAPTDAPTDTPQDTPDVSPKVDTDKVDEGTDDSLLKPLVKTEKPAQEEVPKDQVISGLVNEILDSDSQELTEDQISRLKETGLSQEMLNTLVKAQHVTRQENDRQVFELVGGEETYSEMAKFASENYTDEQLEAYNSAVFSGNKESARLAILGLQADYKNNLGPQGPKETLSGNQSPSTSNTYNTQQEVLDAMRDHRYGRDHEYTNQVDARRANSRY